MAADRRRHTKSLVPMTATRIRIGTYHQRKPINWRVPKSLHSALTALGEANGVTSTALVIDLAEKAARRPPGQAHLAKFLKDGPAGGQVSVTLRIDPNLANSLKTVADAAGLSVNRFITFIVWVSLTAGER